MNPAPEPIPANAGAGGTGGSVPVVRQDFATLREAAAAVGRLVGAAVDPSALGQPNYSETLAREFDYVTPENATKWEVLAPSSSTYDWSGADVVIDFARDNAQVTKGHTFVWHLQYPSWLEGLSAADLRAAMQRHIETTLERYRGRVRAWDVVNEAVDVSTPSGYTESVFYRTLGPEFIADAFRIAREADPDVLLFYNEIGIERLGEKSDFTHQMIRDLLDQGVPIDGIGLQSHVSTHRYPSENDLRTNIRRFADLGLLVNISEADSRTLGFPGDRETRWQTQRIAFAQIVGSCVLEPGCEAVTFWGFTDNYSWLNEEEPEDALLFDREYIPKPAYDGAMDGFRGILPVRGRNVVDNPTFAEGAAAWEASGGELRVTTTTDRDGNVACSTARTSEADGILQVDLTSALAEGGPMSFSAMVRVDGEAVAQAAIVVTQGDETTELNVATRLIQPARWFELSGYLGLGFDSPPSNIGLKLYGPPAGVELCVADVALQPLSMP